MHDKWSKDLVFRHPKTGQTAVIQDAESANIFLTHYWAWSLTGEFYEAVWACKAERATPVSPEDVRDKVKRALHSVSIGAD